MLNNTYSQVLRRKTISNIWLYTYFDRESPAKRQLPESSINSYRSSAQLSHYDDHHYVVYGNDRDERVSSLFDLTRATRCCDHDFEMIIRLSHSHPKSRLRVECVQFGMITISPRHVHMNSRCCIRASNTYVRKILCTVRTNTTAGWPVNVIRST